MEMKDASLKSSLQCMQEEQAQLAKQNKVLCSRVTILEPMHTLIWGLVVNLCLCAYVYEQWDTAFHDVTYCCTMIAHGMYMLFP